MTSLPYLFFCTIVVACHEWHAAPSLLEHTLACLVHHNLSSSSIFPAYPSLKDVGSLPIARSHNVQYSSEL